MELIYDNNKLHDQCTSLKEAKKLFGGNAELAVKLHARITALESANVLKDIILTKPMRFHALKGDKEGLFSIDVKTKAEPWRILLQPLNENKEPYDPCNIDEISTTVRIVKIEEVSKHYE